jgi:hypothetical protein
MPPRPISPQDDGSGWEELGCASAIVLAAGPGRLLNLGPSSAEVAAGCAVARDWGAYLLAPPQEGRFSKVPGQRNAERHFVFAAALSYNVGAAGAFAALEIHERYGFCYSPVDTECDGDQRADRANNEWGVAYGLRRRFDYGRPFAADNRAMFDSFLAEARRLIVNAVLDVSADCPASRLPYRQC